MHTLKFTSGSEEARHFLASIVESSQDSIISVSFDGIIISWNAAAELMYGYSAAGAVGKSLSMLILPEDFREIIGNIDKIKHSRQVGIYETERIGKDGHRIFLEVTMSPIKNDGGEVIGVSIIARDIIKRKRADESLRRSEENLADSQRIARIGSWEMDLVTNQILWSNEVYRIFGVFKDNFEVTLETFFSFIHPKDRQSVQDAADAAISGNTTYNIEHRIITQVGEERIVCAIGEVTSYESGKPRRFTGTVQDVTERKQAEHLIIESEEKYRVIVETANEGVWLADVESVTTYVNRQMAEMLGYTVDEMVGRPIFDFIFEDDFSAANHKVTQRIEGKSETNEFRLRRKDGSEIITQYNVSPIRNQAGEIVGFLSMNTDITERKKAEEALRFQAHLLNTVEQSVIATDLDGNVTYWNQFAEKLYGWTSAEAVRHSAKELTSPEISQEQAAQVMKRLNEGESWTAEVVMQNKSGARFPVHISTSPVNDDKGNLVGKVGVSIDITKRKNAETALRQTEDKYRSLIESSPAVVYLMSPYPPFAPIYISPNITRFGYTTEEWLDQANAWVNIIHEEDRELVARGVKDVIEREDELDINYRIVKRDGTIMWIHDKGRFVSDEHGNKTGWQGVMLDISETKALEEQLRQSQKLESVGLLAGGIAHDFNNMLTAINGYSDMTLRKLKADDPLCSNIEEIKKAGERSAALTQQLLAFSRQQVMQPVIIDLNETIAEISKMLMRLLGEDIQLTTTLNSKLGRIKADPGQLSQIITNLAINARDAMPLGGKLTVETDNVFLDPEYARRYAGVLPGAYVMLAVSDNGTGMSDKTKEHIFEPFFTTKEVGQGTGLGLATVYGIVKQSGGNIEVDSEEGIGTTFKIYLPRVADQTAPEKIKGISAELHKGTERILLVEDEDLVRHLSRQILEESGYTVIEARNGLHALEVCEQEDCKIDLLLTDVVMPQMGGRELAEKLRSRLPEIKILFTSGYTDDAIVRHGVIEADTNFIQKPFSPDNLAEKIREILDNI